MKNCFLLIKNVRYIFLLFKSDAPSGGLGEWEATAHMDEEETSGSTDVQTGAFTLSRLPTIASEEHGTSAVTLSNPALECAPLRCGNTIQNHR
jgi:hypothetical protein